MGLAHSSFARIQHLSPKKPKPNRVTKPGGIAGSDGHQQSPVAATACAGTSSGALSNAAHLIEKLICNNPESLASQ
jgi:hypothetical protein